MLDVQRNRRPLSLSPNLPHYPTDKQYYPVPKHEGEASRCPEVNQHGEALSRQVVGRRDVHQADRDTNHPPNECPLRVAKPFSRFGCRLGTSR